MAHKSPPVSTVFLPCYAGYTQFAMWPAPQLVSITILYMFFFNIKYSKKFHIIVFQNVSCYGLLDLNTILSPSTTGQYLEVTYYPGYQYVAFRAEDPKQVINC